jgi:hypothetical protein
MTEAILIENLKTMLLNIQDRRHIAADNDKWENFKVQVPNYFRYSQSKNDNPLRSVHDIISKCKEHEITIPELYVP